MNKKEEKEKEKEKEKKEEKKGQRRVVSFAPFTIDPAHSGC